MKFPKLNVAAAAISFSAACVWFAIRQNTAGFIWFVCTLFWLATALASQSRGR